MRYPLVAASAAAVIMALAAAPATAQEADAAWTPPQTPWGHPDLQGVWGPDHRHPPSSGQPTPATASS